MNSEQEKALSLIRSFVGRQLLIDFDYTLFLANSTDEFIRAAKPGWLCFLICCMIDTWLRWQAPSQFNQRRDFLRIKWILRLLPWTLPRWRKTAGSLMRRYLNQPLWNELNNPESQPLIVSYGCEEIIRPLLNELTPDMRLVASSIQKGVNLRLSSKVQAVKQVLSEDELKNGLAITDSEDDRALLDAVDKGLLVEWVHPRSYRMEDIYFPLHYLQHCRYADSNYLRGQVMLEDLPLLLCAFVSISAPLHAVAAVLLYFSLLIVYEMGYFENDGCADRRAEDSTRPKRFDSFRNYPSAQGWVWAILTGFAGVIIIPGGGMLMQCLKWGSVLVILRGLFHVHNHMPIRERYFTYPMLSLMRYGAVAVMLPAALPGLLLLGAQISCQTANYIAHRTGGRIAAYRRQSFRLLVLLLLLVTVGILAGWRVYQTHPVSLACVLFVSVALIVIKEPRTTNDLRGWFQTRRTHAASGDARQAVPSGMNLNRWLSSEKILVEQIRSFTGPQIKNIAIWGAGKNGRAIAALMKKNFADINVVCFLDDREDISCVDHIAVRRAPFDLADIDGVFIAMNASEEAVEKMGSYLTSQEKPWIHVLNSV